MNALILRGNGARLVTVAAVGVLCLHAAASRADTPPQWNPAQMRVAVLQQSDQGPAVELLVAHPLPRPARKAADAAQPDQSPPLPAAAAAPTEPVPLVAVDVGFGARSVAGLVGAEWRPFAPGFVGLRVVGMAGPELTALDGLAVGARASALAQLELRVGDVLLDIGPRIAPVVLVDGAATGHLGMLLNAGISYVPNDGGLGVNAQLEGGMHATPQSSALVGSAILGVVIPLGR